MATKWIGLVTPKLYSKIEEEKKKLPDEYLDIEFIDCIDIYMNLIDPNWTSEMCDNTVYIIPREEWENRNKITFREPKFEI